MSEHTGRYNEEMTGAVLTHLKETGHTALMADNGWQIIVELEGMFAVLCVFDDEIEVNLDLRVEYLELADPICWERLEKLFAEGVTHAAERMSGESDFVRQCNRKLYAEYRADLRAGLEAPPAR